MENIFIVVFGLTMLYIAAASRLSAHINMLMVQGWLLFFICMTGLSREPWFDAEIFSSAKENLPHISALLFVTAETIGVKAVLIPLFLRKVLNKTHAYRDSKADIPHFYALVISSAVLFAGLAFGSLQTGDFKLVPPLFFGVSASVILTSLWMITVKRTVLSNVISFITMENGIFLFSIAASAEMPAIVSLGVLLDVFIAVFILGMLVKEIGSEFEDLGVSHLSNLKDYEE